MTDAKTIILKILEAINYSEDKDAFAGDFLTNIQLEAVRDLTDKVDQGKKQEIVKKLRGAPEGKDAIMILEEYFTPDHVEETLKNVAENSIQEYIKNIMETLDDSQREGLINYMDSLSSSPQAI